MISRNSFIASAIASTFLLPASSMALEMSSAITSDMKANAEKAIKSCEQSYQNTKKLRNKFDDVKKPGLLSSQKKEVAYKNLEANRKAFDLQFSDFTRFTNEKINIRTAKALSDLRDKVAAYSSNCSRFASGLAGFVEWATTGEASSAGFAKLYKGWQNEAREHLKK